MIWKSCERMKSEKRVSDPLLIRKIVGSPVSSSEVSYLSELSSIDSHFEEFHLSRSYERIVEKSL